MEKIFTELVHLMCSGMNFGIAMSVNSGFDKDRKHKHQKCVFHSACITGCAENSRNSYCKR